MPAVVALCLVVECQCACLVRYLCVSNVQLSPQHFVSRNVAYIHLMDPRTRLPNNKNAKPQTPSLTSGSVRSSSSSMFSSHDSGLGGSTTVGRASPPLIELDSGTDTERLGARRPLALNAGAGVTAGDKLRALLRQMDAEVRATQPVTIPKRPSPKVREEESSGSRSPPSPPPRISNLYPRRSLERSRSDGEEEVSPPRRLPSRVVALNAAAAASKAANRTSSLEPSEQKRDSPLHKFIASHPTPIAGPSTQRLQDSTPRPRNISLRKGKERSLEQEPQDDWSTSRQQRGESSLANSRTPSERRARPRPGKTPRRTSIDIPPDTSASFAAGLQIAPEVAPDLDDSDVPWVEDDDSIESSEVSVPIDLQRGPSARFMAAEEQSFSRSRESLHSASFATANEGATPRPRQRIPTDTSLPTLPDPESTDDDDDDSPVLRHRAEMFRPSPRNTPTSRIDESRRSQRDTAEYADAPSYTSRSWSSRAKTVRQEDHDKPATSMSLMNEESSTKLRDESSSFSRPRRSEQEESSEVMSNLRSNDASRLLRSRSNSASSSDALSPERSPRRSPRRTDDSDLGKWSTTPYWDDEQPEHLSARSHSLSRDESVRSNSRSGDAESSPRIRRRPKESSGLSQTSLRLSASLRPSSSSPKAGKAWERDAETSTREMEVEFSREAPQAYPRESADGDQVDGLPSPRASMRAGALTKSLAPVLRDTSEFHDSQLDLWMSAPHLASLTSDDFDLEASGWRKDVSNDESSDQLAEESEHADTLADLRASWSRQSETSIAAGSAPSDGPSTSTPRPVPSTPVPGVTPRPNNPAAAPTPLRSALKKVNTPRAFLPAPGIRWSPEVLANHPDSSTELNEEVEPESSTPPSTPPPSHSAPSSTSPTASPPRVPQTPGMPTPKPPGAWKATPAQVPSTPLPPQPKVAGLQPTQTPGVTPRPPGAWHSPIGRPFNTVPARTSGLRNEWRMDESGSSTTSPTKPASPSIARISSDSVHRIKLSPAKRLQLSTKKAAVSNPATPPRLQLDSQSATPATPPRQLVNDDPETPPPPPSFSIDDLPLDPDSSWTAKLKRVILSPMKPTTTSASLLEAQEALDSAARASAAARLRVASAQKAWMAALATPEPAMVKSARWTVWVGWAVLEILLLWGVFRVTIDYATSNAYRAVYDPYARQYAVGIQLPSALDVFAASRRTPMNLFDLLDFLGIAVARGIWRPPT